MTITSKNNQGTSMLRCTLDEILRTSHRIPFQQNHVQFLVSILKKQNAKGLVVRFHPSFTSSAQEALDRMSDGVFVLACPQLDADFLFTCENGGKGLFGRQKSVFKVFTGSLAEDDFSAGNVFKSFGIAATSINNIFRHEGLLSGPV